MTAPHQLYLNVNEDISPVWQDYYDSPDMRSVIEHLKHIERDICAANLYEFDEDLPFLCSIKLIDDEGIRILNRDYREKDKATNVLSFPSGECDETDDGTEVIYLGDLIFAYETIAREAADQNKSFTDHFTHLCVHGLLHLLGYDHIEDDEAEEMEGLEIKLLKKCGIDNPYEV